MSTINGKQKDRQYLTELFRISTIRGAIASRISARNVLKSAFRGLNLLAHGLTVNLWIMVVSAPQKS